MMQSSNRSVAAKPLAPPPSAQSIVVSVDGGHVKSIRSYQMRSFEVMLACVSNDQGEQQLFSSVPVEADRQRQQLSAVLRDIGATPTTALTVLSDLVAWRLCEACLDVEAASIMLFE
jgi:hypothetical protein